MFFGCAQLAQKATHPGSLNELFSKAAGDGVVQRRKHLCAPVTRLPAPLGGVDRLKVWRHREPAGVPQPGGVKAEAGAVGPQLVVQAEVTQGLGELAKADGQIVAAVDTRAVTGNAQRQFGSLRWRDALVHVESQADLRTRLGRLSS